MSIALRVAVLGAAAALSACGPGRDRARMPDVLLVSLDTLRADRLSCYGNERTTSPNIDALAERGLRFDDAIAPSAHTAPSHVSILTGLDPFAHGVFNRDLTSPNVLALNAAVPTLAELVSEAGWSTAAITQEGQLLEELGIGRGFDFTDFTHDSFSGRIAALDGYLRTQDPNRPQFAFVHTYEPHAPYLPPRRVGLEPFYGIYTDRSYRGPLRAATEALLDGPPGAKIGAPQFDAVAEPTPADVAFLSDLYDENVRWTDHLFATLLETWGRHRDLEDTIVVLFSDHGEAFYEHGAFGHHAGLYRELVHVPLIVAGPGVEPGVVKRTVGLVGLAAGLLEFLDVDRAPKMAAPLVFAGADAERQGGVDAAVFPQNLLRSSGVAFWAGIDDAEHVIFEDAPDAASAHLYDRATDPLQQRDLADERTVSLAGWRERIEEVRRAAFELAERYPVRATGEGAEAERLLQLERLGYR